jgi:molybdopterin synthase catalytic subunit
MRRVGDVGHGAVLLFVGTVRDHAEGRRVSGMGYEAYASMAEAVLSDIVDEAAARWGTDHIAAEHRIGELDLGEVSVAIAVSTPHRVDAYEASRYVIEQIKVRLPVWKHEHFVEGDSRWVPGQTPPTVSGVDQ